MTDKQIIIDGCEFQSDCIEYKDISYLKIMPICVIHELSIACHDKVNKCKYYKLYKQLQAKEQECEELKDEIKHYKQIAQYHGNLSVKYTNKSARYKQTLTKIKDIAEENIRIADLEGLNGVYRRGLAEQILQKISDCEENNDMENN